MKVYLVGSGSQSRNISALFDEHEFTHISLEGIRDLPLASDAYFCTAFGDLRKSHLASVEMAEKGYQPLTLIHETAFVHHSSTVGLGAQLFPNAYLGPRVNIGSYAVVNTGAIIEHDCSIGEHSVISPGAVLLGGVKVAGFSTIGAGASVLPGLKLASETTLGAASTLTRDISNSGKTWIGTPAREVV